MDTGIWATWYNLADDTRDAYLEWAHGTYLPFLKQLPGYAWVAHYRHEGGGPKMKRVEETVVGRTDEDIGAGYQYVMLVGAPSAHTFFHPALSEIELPDSFTCRQRCQHSPRDETVHVQCHVEADRTKTRIHRARLALQEKLEAFRP